VHVFVLIGRSQNPEIEAPASLALRSFRESSSSLRATKASLASKLGEGKSQRLGSGTYHILSYIYISYIYINGDGDRSKGASKEFENSITVHVMLKT
jgi:hypothetical protein